MTERKWNLILLVHVILFNAASGLSLRKQPIEVTVPKDTFLQTNLEERQADDSCTCGKGGKKRIVGGDPAEENAYPWLVAIFWSTGELLCGGAIINSRYVLSATHCFMITKPSDLRVDVGKYDYDAQDNYPSETFGVDQIIMHENFGQASAVDSDIALLKLDRNIIFRENVQPICLTPPNVDYIGKDGIVAGWGRTSFGGPESSVQLETSLPVIDDAICRNNFTARHYTKNMTCAGFLEGGKDACQGDSGGPFFLQDSEDVFIVFGITSFGRGCATPGYPGVYTKVGNYISWIAEHTSDVPQCTRPSTTTPPPAGACGNANLARRKRIVGGDDMIPNRYPWTGIIVRPSSTGLTLQCGATLLSDRYVITTARCVRGLTSLSVILGEYNVKRLDGTEVQRFVSGVHIHPDFNDNNAFTNDLAILRLRDPVVFTSEISPICLPPQSWATINMAGITAVTSGWGWINRDGVFATVEQELFLNISTLTNCRRFYGPSINKNFLCGEGTDHDKGICYYDFGGQLSVTDGDGFYVLVGVSSFVADVGCVLGRPSGFMAITPYLDWISNVTGITIE